ncbi:MAG TPA: helix-turn-helix transcriptional regulator [Actinophytocola sp.]|uniref:helix-turn-helix domain-containing protein n=1 Tax=Actinophytocola sp. TaxID=1872138 RepID=UPI002DBD42E7|nr:helix-turn-helix transcriptional regulator [Actinophytocola sp.]HEU5475662.1 helix-turn-helix transcriptional regulator [Actinophytocola sp.]
MQPNEGAFGDYLRAQMDQHGWSQAELARHTGVAPSVVSRWLRGETGPSIDNVRTLATATRRPVLEVMVAAALLTAEEAKQRTSAPPDPGALSNRELLAEVERRMAGDGARPISAEEQAQQPDRYRPVSVPDRGESPPSRRRKTR